MDDREISVTEALNQTQSWLNAGEYEKTIQASQEILAIEPGNQRALALLKQAEERRHSASIQEEKPQTAPEPEQDPEQLAPEPTPTPEEKPKPDPLANLLEEENTEMLDRNTLNSSDSEKKKLFLAMLIPAILVVLVGGAIIWILSNKQRDAEIDKTASGTVIEQDLTYIENNEERVEDLIQMSEILEEYKTKNGVYPSVQQISSIFLADEDVNELPQDPRHGEIDKSGKAFVYVYAVYNGSAGPNSEYVISALFEDARGFGTPWTRGINLNDHGDFRDTDLSNVGLIEESSSTSGSSGPKVKVKRTE